MQQTRRILWFCLVCVMVQSLIKPVFPQASVKDRAGLFLHRISSGKPSLTFTNNSCVLSCCAFRNRRYMCVSQNQLLTKGMVILRDKIRFYEGVSDWTKAPNKIQGGWCSLCLSRSEVTGLSGRDLGLLFLRCPLHAAGHLPPSSGTRSSDPGVFCSCADGEQLCYFDRQHSSREYR